MSRDPLDRLVEELRLREAQSKTRRHFIRQCTTGMGGLALSGFLASCRFGGKETPALAKAAGGLSERDLNPLATLPPPFVP